MAEAYQTPPPSSTDGEGGFLPPTLPSPTLTNTTAASASARSIFGLPHPRVHSLRPGCAKEETVRRYVEDRMLHINRRFVMKYRSQEPDDEIEGYKSMGELCKDVDVLINILWLSGTPSLQIPYLLNIASEFTTWLESFPPSPTATFSILRKLDHCFASLLMGMDARTKEPLPGFENGLRAGLTRTDMVRCQSLVEQTRVLIVDVMSRTTGDEDEDDEGSGDETLVQTEDETDGGYGSSTSYSRDHANIWEEEDERLPMDTARVYENTLVQLGESLGNGGATGDV